MKAKKSLLNNRLRLSGICLPTLLITFSGQALHAADWAGGTSTDWNTAANWSTAAVPDATGASVKTDFAPIATISADVTAIPSEIVVGPSAGAGQLDHTAGSISVQSGGWPYGWILVGQSGNGTYNIADTAGAGGTLTGFGTGSGNLTTGGDILVGAGWWWTGSTGLLNVNTSGTVHTNGSLVVAATDDDSGTVNIDAGTVTAGAARIGTGDAITASTGALNIDGGSLTLNYRLTIGAGNRTGNGSEGDPYVYANGSSIGTVTLAGGTLTTDAVTDNFWEAGVNMASGYDEATGGTATVNLDGGTLSTLYVFSEVGSNGIAGTSILNFNGGTLKGQANRDNLGGAFIGTHTGDYYNPLNSITRANVRDGGAVIDTNGFNLFISQVLEHSDILDDAPTDGGLTKNGAGQLQVYGKNSFTGPVVVNAGTLYASAFNYSGSATFGTASSITVNTATLTANSNSLFGTYSGHAGPITVNAGGSAITQNGRQDVGLLTLNGGTLASSGTIGADGSWMFGRFTDKKLLVTANSTVSAVKVVFRNGATIDVSSGSNLAFSGTISNNSDGTTSVIKDGGGTLSLSGGFDYTGNTTVNAGTLSVSSASFADTSSITVDATATLNLNTGATDVVAGLKVGVTQYAAGVTYRATDANGGSGTGTQIAGLTGNGKLSVVAAGGYDSWKSNVGNQTPSQDYNNDGVSNGIAYFMNNTGVISLPGIVGGAVTWTNGGNIPASAIGTQFEIQTSQNLSNWSTGSPTINTNSALIYTLPTGQGKWFARLVVTPN
ncbi:MAG: autotransporter-associated beta strand repeat-containing protein [Luteolibacter sp.]